MAKTEKEKREFKYGANIKPKEEKLPLWSMITIGIFALFVFLSSGLFAALLSAAGISIATRNCYRLSKKINANKTVAIWIGILGSLVGLLGYWIYYKIKSKEK